MDEKTMRALLERAAGVNVPPSTVDVARARKAGRRRLRIRRAGLPTASFGVVIAVGALFAGGVLPTGATSRPSATSRPAGHAQKSEHASGPMAPASFDPLAIYATFGWLPHGFSVTNPPTPQTAIQSFADVNGPNGQSIALTVYAAHQCSLTGPFWSPAKGTFQITASGKHKRYLHSKRYPRGLLCQQPGTISFPGPVFPAGHLAGGHPAYLMLDQSGHPTALAWQYARDGWAVAQWSGPRPAQLREMAARVRYQSNLRLAFPFRLAGIPATWKVAGAGSQVEGGKLRGYVLYLGPSQDPAGMTVLIQPSYANACSNIGGPTQNVSFDGTAGVLRTSSESVSTSLAGPVRTEHLQDACFASLHGMFVYVKVTRPDGVGGALGLLRHVHVLGPDPANWTTQPLG
jgi:hypothetical protein